MTRRHPRRLPLNSSIGLQRAPEPAGCHPVQQCGNTSRGRRRWRSARNLVPDAYFAAMCLAHGARLATADRGFARFAGLDWFDPASASN
ncbi:PIN domain-containing protein [Humibacter sp.]|uniref:PIN domain-containing protein n=1 Tax=Humibacter sp. TaxID=1940291 RepID=UPI003F7F1F7A